MQDSIDCLNNYRLESLTIPLLSWRKTLGDLGEKCAVVYLNSAGYRILDTGWRKGRSPELDVVALDPLQVLVFMEVKTRAFARGGAIEFDVGVQSVDERKQRKLIKAARAFCCESNVAPYVEKRFDILAVSVSCYQVSGVEAEKILKIFPSDVRFLHIKDAFRPR